MITGKSAKSWRNNSRRSSTLNKPALEELVATTMRNDPNSLTPRFIKS
jgi:hypothetical protein